MKNYQIQVSRIFPTPKSWQHPSEGGLPFFTFTFVFLCFSHPEVPLHSLSFCNFCVFMLPCIQKRQHVALFSDSRFIELITKSMKSRFLKYSKSWRKKNKILHLSHFACIILSHIRAATAPLHHAQCHKSLYLACHKEDDAQCTVIILCAIDPDAHCT